MSRSRALFLDRDGIINVDHGYVGSVERFVFREGIFDLTRTAQDLGYRLVVITNQSGIARGHYTEADFQALTRWMRAVFARQDIALAGVYHCPYLAGAPHPRYARDSFWRKPQPGMILEAAQSLDLDLARSVFIGDQPSDMAAAAAAGVGRRILVTGRPPEPPDADAVVPDLHAACACLRTLAVPAARTRACRA